MSRDVLTRMDVSTSILEDPKFRSLARRHPELFAVAFTAYVGIDAASWREGERLTAEEGWPLLLTFNPAAVQALQEARLLDSEGRITRRAWANWYEAAAERVQLARDRYARYNAKRAERANHSIQDSQPASQPLVTTSAPRGNHAVETGGNGIDDAAPLHEIDGLQW
jgi:hypothetical protein